MLHGHKWQILMAIVAIIMAIIIPINGKILMAIMANDHGHKWQMLMAILAILMAIINGHKWQ